MAKGKGKTTTRSVQQRTVHRPNAGPATVPGPKAGKKRQMLPLSHPDCTHDGVKYRSCRKPSWKFVGAPPVWTKVR